jgi:hypothetical protein
MYCNRLFVSIRGPFIRHRMWHSDLKTPADKLQYSRTSFTVTFSLRGAHFWAPPQKGHSKPTHIVSKD